MEAKELRIGNMTMRKGFGAWDKHFDECSISHNDIVACTAKPDNFKPIPLTEEWLERFGFTHYQGKWMRLPIYRSLSFISVGLKDNLGEITDERRCFAQPPLKYVHQLQNLYHSLTGEELTLKSIQMSKDLKEEVLEIENVISQTTARLDDLKVRHSELCTMSQPTTRELYDNMDEFVDVVRNPKYTTQEWTGGDGRSEPSHESVTGPALIATIKKGFYLSDNQELIVMRYLRDIKAEDERCFIKTTQ